MLINLEKIKDESMKSKLPESGFTFYPCGSRYFGYHATDSDYDFFFENSDDVCAWLTNQGFECSKMPSNYMDVNTISIWFKGDVNVMEVRSAANRVAVQEIVWKLGERSPKGDTNWWNKRYCELFPDQYEMPPTAEDKQQWREDSRADLREMRQEREETELV